MIEKDELYKKNIILMISSMQTYYIQLEKKLRALNILEYEYKIPFDDKYSINEKGLEECLKEKIPTYALKEKALRIDVESIASVCQIRQGRKTSSIEQCKAIFVTNNNNLAYYANNFLGDVHTVGTVISDVDLSVILWLKSSQQNKDMPKDLLVANALAATEEVTDVFMDGVLSKIKRFKEEGSFDNENAGLILENIYFRRELMSECEANPENLTIEKVKRLKDKYDEEIIKAAGIENGTLRTELAVAQDEKIQAEKERSGLVEAIKRNAKIKAGKTSKIVYWSFICLVYGALLTLLISGTVGCVLAGIEDKLSIWGIVFIGLSIIGLLDTVCGKLKFILKIGDKIKLKVYDKVYYKNIAILNCEDNTVVNETNFTIKKV